MTEDRVPTRFRVARPTTEPRPYRVVYGSPEVEELLRRATNVCVRRGELHHLVDEDWRMLNAAIVRVRQSIHTDFAEGAAQGAGLCEGDQ